MSLSGRDSASLKDSVVSEPTPPHRPGYLHLLDDQALHARTKAAWEHLDACDLCPRCCGVNRLRGGQGYCRGGELAKVASWNTHFWEEPPISGVRGSGTVFFSNCTAACLFCQNYPISQLGVGQEVSIERLAGMMIELQRRGCHNVNLVTPTHYVPQVLAAVELAAARGLYIPLVYNCSGYETLDTLRLLDGVVDIYLPDAKYADDDVARRLSGFVSYVAHNRATLGEMQRQVGSELVLDQEGVARKGMIVRHLVLPARLSQTAEVLAWIAGCLSPETHVSLMSQYFPAHKAVSHPELGRPISEDEYDEALEAFEQVGLSNGWEQGIDSEA